MPDFVERVQRSLHPQHSCLVGKSHLIMRITYQLFDLMQLISDAADHDSGIRELCPEMLMLEVSCEGDQRQYTHRSFQRDDFKHTIGSEWQCRMASLFINVL